VFARRHAKEILMKFILIPVLAAAVFAAGHVQAAGGGSDDSIGRGAKPADPAIEAIQAAVAKSDWASARSLARASVEKNPQNADYHNLYAYSMRMGDKPEMDLVFRHYNEALRLDPKHRGAHEYLGEAYLQTGNLAKAKDELRALDDLCFFACKEYSTLKKAIADYEAKK
jgi:tetratricopeptide (TPR) repeat protein